MTRTLQVFVWLSLVQIAARGADLLWSDPYVREQALDLGGAEAAIWGTACLVSAAVVLVGLLFKRYAVLANGCFMAFATYAMFAWHVMDETVLQVPPDDWRVFADHAVRGLTWLVIGASVSVREGVLRIRREKGDEALGLG